MNYMTVAIDIHYTSNETRALQRGDFPLRGKKREEAAYDFFKWIKREMPYGAELEKVICDGEDITELVRALEKAPLD